MERILEYLGVPQEAPAVVREKRPPAAWPSNSGELVVEDLVVKYAPHLPAILKKLSFYVKPSEKIGIVRFPRHYTSIEDLTVVLLGWEDWVGEVDVGDVAIENGRAEWRSHYVSTRWCFPYACANQGLPASTALTSIPLG